ncbi:MAG: GNAT family N-acetyltransferase [bacterium]
MNIFKRIQILVLVLFPACLFGMKQTTTVLDVQARAFVADINLMTYKILEAVDKKGNKVILECYKIGNIASAFEMQKKALAVISEAFADEIYDFLDDNLQIKAEYVDAVKDRYKEAELASLIKIASLCKDDRKKRVELTRQEWEKSIEENATSVKDLPGQSFVVMAKNIKGDLLGVVTFLISPLCTHYFQDFTDGDVVLEPIAVAPTAQGCGLARLLVFSILTLMPETTRILLGTKIWNKKAQAVYKGLGFSVYSQKSASIKFVYAAKK